MVRGDIYNEIKCESFKDPETKRIRVRPLAGQGLPTYMYIECSKIVREKYKPGTVFRTDYVKVCVKPDGREYLRAKDQMIYKI